MRFGKTPTLLAVMTTVVVFALLPSCSDGANRRELASRMADLEGRSQDEERIAELQRQIRAAENQVESTLEGVRDQGTYWRLLALKYMDLQMWDRGLEAFEKAALIYPSHAALRYNMGLCAAQMAMAATSEILRQDYLTRAENAYRRTIALDSRHTHAYYALSVLLVFELDRPLEAAPLLDTYLSIERSSVNGKFLRARVALSEGHPDLALELYDDIIATAPSGEDKNRARDLRDRVLGGDYGA